MTSTNALILSAHCASCALLAWRIDTANRLTWARLNAEEWHSEQMRAWERAAESDAGTSAPRPMPAVDAS